MALDMDLEAWTLQRSGVCHVKFQMKNTTINNKIAEDMKDTILLAASLFTS